MSEAETGATATSTPQPAAGARCPVMAHPHAAAGSTANQHWWPNQLNLRPLGKNSPLIDPMGPAFDYKAAFESLELAAVKRDLMALMTASQDWWPADFGH